MLAGRRGFLIRRGEEAGHGGHPLRPKVMPHEANKDQRLFQQVVKVTIHCIGRNNTIAPTQLADELQRPKMLSRTIRQAWPQLIAVNRI